MTAPTDAPDPVGDAGVELPEPDAPDAPDEPALVEQAPAEQAELQQVGDEVVAQTGADQPLPAPAPAPDQVPAEQPQPGGSGALGMLAPPAMQRERTGTDPAGDEPAPDIPLPNDPALPVPAAAPAQQDGAQDGGQDEGEEGEEGDSQQPPSEVTAELTGTSTGDMALEVSWQPSDPAGMYDVVIDVGTPTGVGMTTSHQLSSTGETSATIPMGMLVPHLYNEPLTQDIRVVARRCNRRRAFPPSCVGSPASGTRR